MEVIMSYNELYEHKKSDTVKWVLTLIAFIVVGVLIAGLIAGWFDKNEEVPVEQTEQTAAVDGGMSVTPTSAAGVRLMMVQAAAEVSPLAETSYTIKATIEPASARQNANWSVAWANGSSAWATGKTVTDNAHGRGLAYGDTRLRQAVLRAGHSYRQRDG